MYKINLCNITSEDNESFVSYGITYNDIVIKDISVCKKKIEDLISLCNSLELSPLHIHDVVEDFLS